MRCDGREHGYVHLVSQPHVVEVNVSARNHACWWSVRDKDVPSSRARRRVSHTCDTPYDSLRAQVVGKQNTPSSVRRADARTRRNYLWAQCPEPDPGFAASGLACQKRRSPRSSLWWAKCPWPAGRTDRRSRLTRRPRLHSAQRVVHSGSTWGPGRKGWPGQPALLWCRCLRRHGIPMHAR